MTTNGPQPPLSPAEITEGTSTTQEYIACFACDFFLLRHLSSILDISISSSVHMLFGLLCHESKETCWILKYTPLKAHAASSTFVSSKPSTGRCSSFIQSRIAAGFPCNRNPSKQTERFTKCLTILSHSTRLSRDSSESANRPTNQQRWRRTALQFHPLPGQRKQREQPLLENKSIVQLLPTLHTA